MADNIDVTAGSGKTIAADDIGAGVLAQRVKVVWGPDGTGNDTDVASGKRLPVQATGVTVLKTITMTADTGAIGAADIIADTQQLDAAFRVTDGTGILQSIAVFDPDDNAAYSFYVGIHRTSTSLGSENGGITISDANAAAGIIAFVPFATTDCIDLINGKMYQKFNLGIPIQAASGTDDLYVSVVSLTGTPTHGGGSIPIVLGILQD